MLDSVTKKRIDDLRNILVGKIPSPQSQVEQITTGLIYKFMYDMDEKQSRWVVSHRSSLVIMKNTLGRTFLTPN